MSSSLPLGACPWGPAPVFFMFVVVSITWCCCCFCTGCTQLASTHVAAKLIWANVQLTAFALS